MSSITQLHIPYHENKKCTKAKSTFFTFDLCSYTMNMYYKNENPASEPHPFYFNHPLLLSYPCLTPILTLDLNFKTLDSNMNVGLECSTHGTKTSNHRTPTYNPLNKGLKPSNSHNQPMEQRPQTIRLPHTTHGTKISNQHPIPMERRLQTV